MSYEVGWTKGDAIAAAVILLVFTAVMIGTFRCFVPFAKQPISLPTSECSVPAEWSHPRAASPAGPAHR